MLERRGLGSAQIAQVMVIMPIAGLLVPALWGALADALRARLWLLRIASLACGMAVLLFLIGNSLWWAVVAMACLAFFRAPIVSLADAATYDAMGGSDPDFSKVRIFGSIGFASLAFIVGKLAGSAHAVIPIGVAAAAFVLSTLATLPIKTPRVQHQRGVLKASFAVLRHPSMLMFLLASMLYYTGHSTFDAYFGIHARQLGFDDGFVGTAWGIGVGVEVLVMLLAPRFMHRVSPGYLLVPCALVAALRWFLIAQCQTAGALAATQALHGITFGVWYLSLVRFVQTRAPAPLRTTLQSATMTCIGLGMVNGYLGGGLILGSLGAQRLYMYATGFALLAAFVYAAALLLTRSKVD
jgi:PPP family 3-phenylpropionic acid transporter